MEHDINLISHHAETLYVRIFECVYMGVYVKVRKKYERSYSMWQNEFDQDKVERM